MSIRSCPVIAPSRGLKDGFYRTGCHSESRAGGIDPSFRAFNLGQQCNAGGAELVDVESDKPHLFLGFR
jgi:hypothetical protein